MKIATRDFGEVEIQESDILMFPKGILAFEEFKQYVLIHYPDEEIAPMWLQSVENSSLCFIVLDPFLYLPDYSPSLPAAELSELNLSSNDDLRYFVISVISEDVQKSTINLKSPIVVNIKNNRAIQCVSDSDYPVRFPLFSEKGEL